MCIVSLFKFFFHIIPQPYGLQLLLQIILTIILYFQQAIEQLVKVVILLFYCL